MRTGKKSTLQPLQEVAKRQVVPEIDTRKPQKITIDAQVVLTEDMASHFYTVMQVLEQLMSQEEALAYLICSGVRRELEKISEIVSISELPEGK